MPKNIQEYQKRLRSVVESIMDNPEFYQNGTLYERVLREEVFKQLDGQFAIREAFLGVEEDNSFENRRKMQDTLKSASRGSWLIFKSFTQYSAWMSDGQGRVSGDFDYYDTAPTFEYSQKRMVGHEVFTVRQRIETDRHFQANLQAVAGYSKGQIIPSAEIDRKKFTKLKIEEITANGTVIVIGSRRGTSTQLRYEVCRESFARIVEEAQEREAAKPPKEQGDNQTMSMF